MSYFDYRGYIRAKVLEVCPDFKEHKDAFNRENIDGITSGGGYHILPSTITHELASGNCQLFEDSLEIDLQLLVCGGRYVTDQVDNALEKARCIRNKLVDPADKPFDNNTLERVEVTQTTVNGEVSNDNTILVNLSLIMRLNYCIEC